MIRSEARLLIVIFTAVCVTFSVAGPVSAAGYQVFGWVFAAVEVPEGTTGPEDALPSFLTSDQVVGGDVGVASGILAMSRVEVVDDDTGLVLATGLAKLGAYYASFTDPAATLDVRFDVYDGATGELVARTEPVQIAAGVNQRYLVVPAGPREVGGSIPHPAGLNHYAFTRVGLVEAADIGSDGLADFSGAAARWRDAPFGHKLKVFGAASVGYYQSSGPTGNYCYKVKVTPDGGTPFYLDGELKKRRYEVRTVGGTTTVTSTAEKMGPYNEAGGNCYWFTPIAETAPGASIFWSFPDQVAQWDTRGLDGGHDLELEVYRRSDGHDMGVSGTPLTLEINNTSVELSFDAIEVRDATGAVMTDLLTHPCDIVNLSGGRRLHIGYTAHHPDGFLASYALRARSNSSSSWTSWADGAYVPNPAHEFFGVDPATVDKASADIPETCAWLVHLHAWSRTTDGYNRLSHPHALKTYYLQN